MKKIVLLATVALSVNLGYSQEANPGKLKKAKAAYEDYTFHKAAEKYEALELSAIEDKRNLANSYWKTNQLDNAEMMYKEVVGMEDKTSEDVYNYASILRENKKYKESDEWLSTFAQMNASDSRGKDHADNVGAFTFLQKDNGQFSVHNLDINTENQDFGTAYYKDQIVFASSREGFRSIKRSWNRNELPFLDVYIADKDGSQLISPIGFSKKVNKKFHEGPVAFNQAGDMMVFTTNNYKGRSTDKVIRLKLFQSKLVNGKWSKPEAIHFNSPDYSVGHASISADGSWMYFASDMPGGIGGVDIYKAAITEDGSFGQPINMGTEINTEGDEMFPFIHEGGEMIFYSSNGKVGLGGLDVFVAQIKPDETVGKVMNVGAPINSNRDDFAFIADAAQKRGYLSSNREGGKGADDIYSVDFMKPFSFGKTIKGIAKDKDGNILDAVMIELLDADGNVVESVTTTSNGEYAFQVEPDKNWKLSGAKEKYFDGKNTASTTTNEDVVFVNLELEKDPGLSLYAIISDKANKTPLDDVKITLTDNMTGKSEEVSTSELGYYLKPLTDKKLNDRGSYNFFLEKEGYLSKSVTYNVEFDHEGKYPVHEFLDFSMDPIELGGDLSKIIEINPIYFDLNKSKIRPDAALELDKIVKVMNENPNMVIELGSHTDSRGSESSNRSLSDRRAKASAAYVAERITNPERISGKGYGESTPNTVDASVDGGKDKQLLTEEFINAFRSKNKKLFDKYHQYNRRTEFIIIKM